jgi:hypothetical protein
MTNVHIITTFFVLLIGVEAVDKTTSGARHLPNQGPATSMKGWFAGQTFGDLGRDVRVLEVREVQSYLRAEPIEQAISAPLRGGQSRPQDPEAGTIHSFFLSVSFSY